MRLLGKIGLAVLVVLVVGIGWLIARPPELLRVGGAYVAKIACSSIFVANRDPAQVTSVDIYAPENPLLDLIVYDIDEEDQSVSAAILGFAGRRTAIHRPGYGCTVLDNQTAEEVRSRPLPPRMSIERNDAGAEWPAGEAVRSNQDPEISALLANAELGGEGVRALVVVKDGRIVGEHYAETFAPDVPLVGWSMTKSVTATLLGLMADRGEVAYDQAGLFEAWQGDPRSEITLADLAAMAPGLQWDEGYATVSDVTKMLYLRGDMAGFVVDQPLAAGAEPGEAFQYSTGFSVALATALMQAAGDREAGLTMPDRLLFAPLGITTATFELDEADHFSGGSYLYMSPRDWARIGWLLANRGQWNDEQVISEQAVARMFEPAPASNGDYRKGSMWQVGNGQMSTARDGIEGETFPDLPQDTAWMLGHDGQSMAIVPSEGIVMLRMGLTPSSRFYRSQHLLAKVVEALRD